MKQFYLAVLMLFSVCFAFSQTKNRVEVTGKIIVESNDKEGVTVFNTSSNKGTITNTEGTFTIAVKLNDIVEVSALQFEKFTVHIDEKIMQSQQMTVFLVEEINKLDEVVILPYDLSGNLTVDMESVKTFNPDLDAIYFGVNDISVYEFSDDYRSGVKNSVMPNGVDNIFGVDIFQAVGLLADLIFPPKEKPKPVNYKRDLFSEDYSKTLKDYYSIEFITETFNIPENQVDDFIVFTVENNLEFTLYNQGKELEFLELIKQQSDAFLKTKRD